jgi:putative OPT family oligopeptide transporter
MEPSASPDKPSSPRPFIPSDRHPAEFTFRALLLGSLFGVIFGAVTVYLALKVGLTVSASIPISVLSIVIFRRLGQSTILENNLVQTVGSAGESIASGVVFTLPALVFLNAPMPYYRIFLLALSGGILGVLMMIPLRRALIVREHATLRYPEGTACAHILIAGEKGGSLAGRVFAGVGVGVVYKLLMSVARLWREVPGCTASRLLPGLSLSVEASPELLGVGYIVGFRTAAVLAAGGLLSWGVLIPMVKFLGSGLPSPIFPSLVPIAQMSPSEIWSSYVRYIGAGAVAAGGLINLGRALPTIVRSFRDSLRALSERSPAASMLRTERDLPISIVFFGSVLLTVGLFFLIHFDLNPGHLLANLVAALLIVVYGFFFVTVSSRVVGTIGASNNPISGDTITTLMGTCLLFVLVGWTGHAYAAVALSIGAVVCIAAANAGSTSQDLKTGFLVGATPRAQQIGLIFGVLISVGIVGLTLRAMNEAYRTLVPISAPAYLVPQTARRDAPTEYHGRRYEVVYLTGAELPRGAEQNFPEGKYLVDEQGHAAFRYIDGIGGQSLAAPQARLMSLVISGILEHKLPWTLVLFGIFIGIVMELCGVPALPFAVGVYLPISTSTPVFFGGLCRLMSDRLFVSRRKQASAEAEASQGMLFSSGLIAGGALMGLGVAILILSSGRLMSVANALEWLRGDRIELALGPGLANRLKLGGQPIAPDKQMAVRSRRIGSELRPAYLRDGMWRLFQDLRLEISGEDSDTLVITPDPEAPVQRISLQEVNTWDRSITVDDLGVGVGHGSLVRWLAEEGSDVEFGQPLAEVIETMIPSETGGVSTIVIRAPQRGRLRRQAATGQTIPVHGSIGRLELREPPTKTSGSEAPLPVRRRRLVVEPLPSSDGMAMLAFLVLGAAAVVAARPKTSDSPS